MSARTRALAARPGRGRKQHFATLAPGETVWLPVCDRLEIPVFGAVVSSRDDWAAWLSAAQHDDSGALCSLCRTPLIVAAVALEEVEDVRASNLDREALVEENRALWQRILSSGTGALDAARRAIAREKEEARVDRRLARIGR